jgi:hypothetical protein
MKKTTLLLFLAFIGSSLFAQQEKLQAVFIYNFTKYINWPESYREGDFKIGVLGSKAMTDELKQIAQKRKVGTRTIAVESYNSIDEIKKCQMLYISDSKSSLLPKAVLKLSLEPTVIITATDGSLKKGSAINFVIDDGKQKFEVKESNLKKNNLKVSDDLLNLAVKK